MDEETSGVVGPFQKLSADHQVVAIPHTVRDCCVRRERLSGSTIRSTAQVRGDGELLRGGLDPRRTQLRRLFFVPIDAPLPALTIVGDARVYQGLPVPGDPSLRGATLHLQAAAISASATRPTNADSILLR